LAFAEVRAAPGEFNTGAKKADKIIDDFLRDVGKLAE
jgi:hypothetical protein